MENNLKTHTHIYTHTTDSLCYTPENNNFINQLNFNFKKKKFASFMNENHLSPYFLHKPDFSSPIYLISLLHVQVILDSYFGEDVTGMKLKS